MPIEPALPNEIESIFYSKVVDVQEKLNEVIVLLKKSRKRGCTNAWNTLIDKYHQVVEMEAVADVIVKKLDWDLNNKYAWEGKLIGDS